MFPRFLAPALLLFAAVSLRAQDAIPQDLPAGASEKIAKAESAWIDLRQTSAANSKPQSAPKWVESVTVAPAADANGAAGSNSVFRIRLSSPPVQSQMLLFRLFFDDKPDAEPTLTAWDESGTQVLQSGVLGQGLNLQTSSTVMVPMNGTSTIDINVPGDGKNVRGAYLDWMANAEVLHPINVEHRDLIPEPFSAAPPLHIKAEDAEQFGTVTATLSDETIRIGPSVQNGASFQFALESQPLVALLTFEVASPNIDSPPEVYLNGENIGAVSLTWPELADPGYRGEMGALMREMRFQYTGWVRAQKLVPASSLRSGTNDLLIIAGPGTPASAVRATQVQLKYLWDKSDYELIPETK